MMVDGVLVFISTRSSNVYLSSAHNGFSLVSHPMILYGVGVVETAKLALRCCISRDSEFRLVYGDGTDAACDASVRQRRKAIWFG